VYSNSKYKYFPNSSFAIMETSLASVFTCFRDKSTL